MLSKKKSSFIFATHLHQLNKFDEITKNFPNAIFSISNSKAIINYESMNYDMVRSGGNIFGVTSNDFKQSFSLYARVLQIAKVSLHPLI